MAKTNAVRHREALTAFWNQEQHKLGNLYSSLDLFLKNVKVIPITKYRHYFKDVGASVGSDSIVANGAFLANGVEIQQSRISAACFIGPNVEITRSVVHAEHIGADSSVEMSTLGSSVKVGESCKIEGSDIGAGVKIGDGLRVMNSFIEYGCTINNNVEQSTIRSNAVISAEVLYSYIGEDAKINVEVNVGLVYENVELKRSEWFMSLGPIGSRNDFMTVIETHNEKSEPYLLFYIGCYGKGRTVVELVRDINRIYPEHGNRHRVAYLSMIRFVQTMRAAHWMAGSQFKYKVHSLPKF